MKIVNVDGRHARYGQGYKVFIQLDKEESYNRYRTFFETRYGPSRVWVQKQSPAGTPNWGFYKSNTDWFLDIKRRRVYLLNPADVSLLLLVNT